MELSAEHVTDSVSTLAVALGVGLLIGIERERRKGDGPTRAAAGVRTFALTAVLGALAAIVGNDVLLAIAGAGVVIFAAVSYWYSSEHDPGLTTEVALLATFVVGVLSAAQPLLAGASGVLIAVLLLMRAHLHGFAQHTLSEQELRDAILLAAAAMIILPLLPNRFIDPWGAVNPHVVWRLTVVVMLVNAAGYVAQRALGAKYGLPLSGLLAGFVSSTAVHAAMGRRAKEDESARPGAVAAAALSNVATFAQLAIVLSLVNATTLRELAPAIIAASVVAVIFGLFYMRAALRQSAAAERLTGRAFSLLTALLFALSFVALSFVAVLMRKLLGAEGVVLGAAAGGFLDAHSSSAAVANLVGQGALEAPAAAVAIALVVTANTMSKLLFARAGGGAFFVRVGVSLVAILAVFWLVVVMTGGRFPIAG